MTLEATCFHLKRPYFMPFSGFSAPFFNSSPGRLPHGRTNLDRAAEVLETDADRSSAAAQEAAKILRREWTKVI
jgi:hypothetical protein